MQDQGTDSYGSPQATPISNTINISDRRSTEGSKSSRHRRLSTLSKVLQDHDINSCVIFI